MMHRTGIVALVLCFAVAACETSSAPSPAVSSASSSAASAPPAGKGPIVTLGGGATVTLPAGLEIHRAPSTLPDPIKATHTYAFPGSDKRLLVVTELALDDADCTTRLDAEVKKLQAAQVDSDKTRAALRKMGTVEDTKVGRHRVLYSEAMQRGVSEKDKARPFAPVTTAMMCEGANLLAIMHIAAKGDGEDIRALLNGVVKSYQPAK